MEPIKPHKIIRSNRRTIALVVGSDATLTVRAPHNTPLDFIEDLIRRKARWIISKISDVKARKLPVEKEYVSGESFFYLGKSYKLRIAKISKDLIFGDTFILNPAVKSPRTAFVSWYKAAASRKITERVDLYAKRAGLKYKSLRITDAQKRWGSCSARGTLNFSWRLIMAPLPVIDYVVVHELAHFDVKNHSKDFWKKVRILNPGYMKGKEWLAINERLLQL